MMHDKPEPIGKHLTDLRAMLIRMLVVVALAAGSAFAFAPALFRLLQRPYLRILESAGRERASVFLQTLEPSETFKISFTVALILGSAVVLPYLLYELWRFIRTGLFPKERRFALPIVVSGTLLFFGGALFAYFMVVPLVLAFFWDYSLRLGVTPAWSISQYIDFVLGLLVAFGLSFELPVVASILAAAGIVSAQMMRKIRGYAIFAICLVSALLTPSDVASMLLMAIPLVALYEISILIATVIGRKQQMAVDTHRTQDGEIAP
ncbi:MAG: twin-arginine translocase subunit TatC [Deltaproteobacteria bacterium]|nr:twin-arginine translocase subunit TatC [Deltaproteobacteria bacterium]